MKCSFFGHRTIKYTEELKQKLKQLIEFLIVNYGVQTFLFGSRSEFNYLCHLVVTELKGKYTKIKRIAYTCKSESCVLEREREKWEKIYASVMKKETQILCVEEEKEHKTKYTAGRASYIERNQAMINDSDYCIFYYDENYRPRKSGKVVNNQPKSGTAIAYVYAKQKKKIIYNVKELYKTLLF